MATPTDFVYNNARYLFATAQINWAITPVNAMLVSALYVPSLAHSYVTDVTAQAGSIVIRDIALTNLGVTSAGVCYGTVPELGSFLSATQVAGLILYQKLGSDAASQLLYYTSSGYGFPFLPVGFNYDIGFDQANGGYFQV